MTEYDKMKEALSECATATEISDALQLWAGEVGLETLMDGIADFLHSKLDDKHQDVADRIEIISACYYGVQ